MPAPSSVPGTLRPDLVGAMEEFPIAAAEAGMIAYEVAPLLEVGLQADNFGKIPIEAYLQQLNTKRASGSGYQRDDFEFDIDSYATIEHGLEGVVDDRDAKRYRSYFDAELKQAQRKRFQVLLAAEKRVADLVFNASTFTGALTNSASAAWDDYANAAPIDDGEAAAQAFYNNTGLWPNTMILGRVNYRNLRQCAQIIDRISSTGAGDRAVASDINPQKLAEVFDIDRVLVGGMATNTANKGLAATIGSIWNPDYAMLAYIADDNSIETPSLARTFHWSDDGSAPLGTIETYREDDKRSTIVRVRHEVHEKLMYPQLGYLITGCAS